MANRIQHAKRAIDLAGGYTSLAKKLIGNANDAELKKMGQRVLKWRQTGIPPKFVIPVESITGVSRHKLHPDIYPPSEKS